MRISRAGWRSLALVLGLALITLLAILLWQEWLARNGAGWTHDPEDAAWVLPPAARTLVKQSFADADDRAVLDHRVGIVSRGQLSGPDFSNDSRENGRAGPNVAVWLHRRLRDAAAGIAHDSSADADYVSRLVRQIRAMPGAYRAMIAARDGVFDAKGAPRRGNAEPTVSNRYVAWLAKHADPVFEPVVSIHPRRPDVAEALARWAEQGAREISWWPLAQQIDLGGPAAKAAYPIMAKHHMQLDVPVGQLDSADGDSTWIAPAAVEPALAAGVPVRLRLGGAVGRDGQRLMPALFELLRKQSSGDGPALTVSLAGLLVGDRSETELEPLLEHPQFFKRLRYASSYPQPARAGAIDLHALAARGFIARSDIQPLAAIYDVNPLLFAFVVMRHVHLPATDLALPAAVFFAGKASED